MTPQADFQHEVLFYSGPDGFLAGTLPYLRGAIEASEPALVAVGPQQTAALEGELGGDAAAVTFVDMEEIGRNPARIIPFWREFVDGHCGPERPVRGIGEPIWAGRTAHELDECQRHERLLNVAFDGVVPWSLLCPYDADGLSDEVLLAAERCHPFVLRDGVVEPNFACGGGSSPVFDGKLPPRPGSAAKLEFDRSGLGDVRRLVRAEAESTGLDAGRISDLVTATSELAANSVAHGGGRGTVWVWVEAGDLVVEVGDAGLIEEPLVGRRKPLAAQDGGRGLWIANLLCNLVQIRSGKEGTAVRLRMSLER
jgi:anti-sigma regulatory factor (Ser/Thr protein kinase)